MKFLRATNNIAEAAAKRFIVIVVIPSAIVFALFNYKSLIQRSIDDPAILSYQKLNCRLISIKILLNSKMHYGHIHSLILVNGFIVYGRCALCARTFNIPYQHIKMQATASFSVFINAKQKRLSSVFEESKLN